MNWDIGCSRNIFLSLRDKSKVFCVILHYEFNRYSYTVLEAQNFPKLENLDIESQMSEFKLVIYTDYAEQVLYIVQINNKLPFQNIVGTDISGVF